MTQTVKDPPATQETQVRSLGQEFPLEKERRTGTHCSLCAPLLLLPSVFPSIRVFSNESSCQWLFNSLL